MMPSALRFVTYLAPGIPEAFFKDVTKHVERETGIRCELQTYSTFSGPGRDEVDPFSSDLADVGFICSPSFVWLRDRERPPIELLPAAPVFCTANCRGRPVSFSDIVVRRDNVARSFQDLRACRWAYNDPYSQSGYYCVVKKLHELSADLGFFSKFRQSGSHLGSIQLVISGEVDACAIDSNVLAYNLRCSPELRKKLRVIESWGPYPVQPIVVRTTLGAAVKQELAKVLLATGECLWMQNRLIAHGVERFARVTETMYDGQRRALRDCERFLNLSRQTAAARCAAAHM